MIPRFMTLLATVVAIVAIAVGCGGGGSGDSTSTTSGSSASGGSAVPTSSLSKAEFIKQASAACEKERKKLIPKMETYFSAHSSEGLPEGVLIANLAKKAMLPTIEAEIAAIRKLGAPEGDEGEIEAILAAQQAAVNDVKALKEARSLEVVERQFRDAAAKLHAYGFTACTTGA